MKRYRDDLVEALKDPKEAAEYLSAALEDKDPNVFLLALRDVAEAFGGIGKLARRSKMNRENLYRMLSESGNPEWTSLNALLHALGFNLAVGARKAG